MAIANFPSAWMNDEHRALEDAARRFMTGKLKVQGDMSVALRMQRVV